MARERRAQLALPMDRHAKDCDRTGMGCTCGFHDWLAYSVGALDELPESKKPAALPLEE